MAVIERRNFDDNKSETNKNEYMKFNNDNSDLNFLNEIQSAEYISMFGTDIQYIKIDKDNMSINYIIGEIISKTYSDVINLRMLQQNLSGFDGGGDIFNLGGLSVPDEMTFLIDIATLERFIERKPLISDLLYHEASNKIFKISWIDDEVDESFYNGGKNFMYKLVCKEHKLSKEKTTFTTTDSKFDNLNNIDNLSNITDEQDDNAEDPNITGEFYMENDNPFL